MNRSHRIVRLLPAALLLAPACAADDDPGRPPPEQGAAAASFSFTVDPAALPQDEVRGRRPLLVDLDGDRDLDLFLAAREEPPWVLANDGTGRFTAIPQLVPLAPVDAGDAAAGDVDGDGDPDIVIAALESGADVLLLNDGRGALSAAPAGSFGEIDDRTTGIALVDVDGDADLDCVTANWHDSGQVPPGLRLLRNDGGAFVDVTAERLPADATPTFGVAPLDADGDGDVDLFASTDGASPACSWATAEVASSGPLPGRPRSRRGPAAPRRRSTPTATATPTCCSRPRRASACGSTTVRVGCETPPASSSAVRAGTSSA